MTTAKRRKKTSVEDRDRLAVEKLLREYVEGKPVAACPARAVVLPHYKNRQQSPDGEWILTAILDSAGNVVEQREHYSLGTYPNRATADREIGRYLSSIGASQPAIEYIVIPETTWQEVQALMTFPSGEDFAWSIFARSHSNEDIIRYIANVKRVFRKE